jgi:hypothetical protein
MKERKRRHDDAHRPLGGRGKRAIRRRSPSPCAAELIPWNPGKEISMTTPDSVTEAMKLAELRAAGLMVAVHNDYRLNGELHTFWLFTTPDGRALKGEGKTDMEALEQVSAALAPSPISPTPQAVEALMEALSPFSRWDGLHGNGLDDATPMEIIVTMGDLRRANLALSTPSPTDRIPAVAAPLEDAVAHLGIEPYNVTKSEPPDAILNRLEEKP